MTWHPVAAAADLPFRHVFHGQLLGRELVAWRADDGFVNVWENRCLHRGVRLSVGYNDGRELRCVYHGWRYANRTGGCTYIPAHPADAPARTICNRVFPAVEKYGLVWSGEDAVGEVPDVASLEGAEPFVLRSLPVNAPAALVTSGLVGYDPDVVVFVQPVDSARSVIRPVLAGTPAEADQIAVLRDHNARLSERRDALEEEAASMPTPEPMVAAIEQVPVNLSGMPEKVVGGRAAPLRVRVARKWACAEGIAAFQLESIGGQLPTFQAGAHIDVHLPNGLVRQYSVTNGPGELEWYRIGVKREPESRGGSETLHDQVHEGDVLAISEPRNNFPLRRDAVRTVLVAGGIGITPLLAMAQALHHDRLSYELHTFAQSEAHLAFPEVLDRLGDGVTRHLGLAPTATTSTIEHLLADYDSASHVYVCGPSPMLEATRRIAADAGWPEDAVHFEYFANPTEIDDSSTFEVSLARSALTLQVPGGQTILEVLRANGVAVPSSCEQGACGTCSVGVIEGTPDHQDVFLSDGEKQRGDRVMVCVSRARSARLVLDV